MKINFGIRILLVFAFVFLFNIFTFAQLNVEPDISGVWAVNKTLSEDEQPFEGTLTMCEEGTAVYLVHSNQLVIYMTVKQQLAKDKSLTNLFYMNYADTGKGYSNFDGFPKKGTLLMKGTWTQEYELTMQNVLSGFVKRLRAVTDAKDFSIFPKHFYKNTYAGVPNCN